MTREEWIKQATELIMDINPTEIKSHNTDESLKEWCHSWQIAMNMLIVQAPLEQEPSEDMGDVSDGYHTFNQLYHQRAVLFATIVNQNKDKAWKSYKHSDGKYCFDSNGEWFIVGIDTPKGSYTYHYETDKYWDMFDCKELECGKEWDGHTEEDVTRLLSLQQEPKIVPIAEIKFDDDMLHEIVEEAVKNIKIEPRWIPVSERLPKIDTTNGFKASDVVLVCLADRKLHMAFYCDDGVWRFCESGEAKEPMWDKVIAWMPLPEPYRKGEADDKT